MRKVPATFDLEKSLWNKNLKLVVGIDEVGRGAWAGPLVAAAVVFPQNYQSKIKYYDSKLLSFKERQKLSEMIKQESSYTGIGKVEVEEVNNLGLTKATQIAYTRAVEALPCFPEHYLIDAFYIEHINKSFQTPIVRGDYLCSSIAAASIIAKVHRDNLMINYAQEYPDYYFDLNKGYGTKHHQEAILKLGLTPLHRVNYDLKILHD